MIHVGLESRIEDGSDSQLLSLLIVADRRQVLLLLIGEDLVSIVSLGDDSNHGHDVEVVDESALSFKPLTDLSPGLLHEVGFGG